MISLPTKHLVHFNGLPWHPCVNTVTIDHVLPQLETRVRQYGEAKTTMLCPNNLDLAINGASRRLADHSEALMIQIELEYSIVSRSI
jgi:hypothetical protein